MIQQLADAGAYLFGGGVIVLPHRLSRGQLCIAQERSQFLRDVDRERTCVYVLQDAALEQNTTQGQLVGIRRELSIQ